MSWSMFYALGALIVLAPHLSRRQARWVSVVAIAFSLVAPWLQYGVWVN